MRASTGGNCVSACLDCNSSFVEVLMAAGAFAPTQLAEQWSGSDVTWFTLTSGVFIVHFWEHEKTTDSVTLTVDRSILRPVIETSDPMSPILVIVLHSPPE